MLGPVCSPNHLQHVTEVMKSVTFPKNDNIWTVQGAVASAASGAHADMTIELP